MNYTALIAQIRADARRAWRAGYKDAARHMGQRIQALKRERAEVFLREISTANPQPKAEPVPTAVNPTHWLTPMGIDETIEQAIWRVNHDR